MSIRSKHKPTIGKYVLDSLSIGMYNHPLMLVREYIQNSVDAIDTLANPNLHGDNQSKVEIKVEWRSKSLIIADNGCGISADLAYNTLNDLGRSYKKSDKDRGFRGIGRLGGLGYCERITFKTKANGEKHYSLSTWDCIKLRKLINEEDNSSDVFHVLREVTSFEQNIYEGNKLDHFFIVEMNNVKSSRDILLNVPEIKAYLSQVAPVPYDSKRFTFANHIDSTLKKLVPKYDTYNIYVNGEHIFKPYCNEIPISDKHKDTIEDIDFVEFRHENNLLAVSWIAKLRLLGVIRNQALSDCLRVRSGNILIGDKYLLSDFFRERRFNHYLVGEVHTIDSKLTPNSRRDDFEDNHSKENFLSCFIKEVGLPYSSLIRRESVKRTEGRKAVTLASLIETANKVAKRGYFSQNQKKKLLEGLSLLRNATDNISGNRSDFDNTIRKVQASRHYALSLNGNISSQRKKLLVTIIEDIYDTCQNKAEAEKIISKIVKTFNLP